MEGPTRSIKTPWPASVDIRVIEVRNPPQKGDSTCVHVILTFQMAYEHHPGSFIKLHFTTVRIVHT